MICIGKKSIMIFIHLITNNTQKEKKYMYDNISKIFLVVTGMFLATVCCLMLIALPYSMFKEHSTLNDAERLAATDEYTTYLDGQEIDFSNIDPENYSITIDYENQKIILTSRRRNVSTIYVPPVHY